MPRNVLSEEQTHPAIRAKIESYQPEIMREVRDAIASHDVVVVGMAQNPFPRKTRKLLDEARIAYHYIEYGSYLSEWRKRLALKMWTGWSTFPMVFVKGTFVGGFEDTRALLASGELAKMLGR